jgi:hypothetical protein
MILFSERMKSLLYPVSTVGVKRIGFCYVSSPDSYIVIQMTKTPFTRQGSIGEMTAQVNEKEPPTYAILQP